MKIELGKSIKEERQKKHLTQQELADYLNISRQTISKWELDKSYPDLELLVQMSRLFEVSVDHLLGIENATEKQKRSVLDFIFQTNPEGIYEPSAKERNRMKTICFVVYVSQGINYHFITAYGHFSQIRLINALKKKLSPHYDVHFDPSTIEEEPDLYIVPEPFKLLVSYSQEKTLLLPGNLFVTKDTAAIKEHIDHYFAEKQAGA
ncbi:helix-turn-helix domain-containing protein [Candidatus Enterococcus ferrettii]|uniref:HTH cro/C1-type domain-containing protein n=1 Tax=Candidatus Enterococcus ferrettii TaxID=2815324 RepID=A0ABV0EIV4_9ENTE|nr:helix-turn-helix transcriptional regulator [Enterococcus sp. 665A]